MNGGFGICSDEPTWGNRKPKDPSDNEDLSTVPIHPEFLAHPSGALWIPASRVLVVADLHLGYGWAQRRKGELGPLADARTVSKLNHVCTDLQPAEIVFLGDLVHAPRPCAEERTYIETVLRQLATCIALTSVRGNHDRAFAKEFAHLPVRVVESWSNGKCTALHGDKLPSQPIPETTLLLGHLHPSMPVKDVAGAGRRLPAFLSTSQAIILPAFSPFAHGYNLIDGVPPEFLALMGTDPILAHVSSGSRVVCVGPVASAIERMYQADVGAASVFRRRNAMSKTTMPKPSSARQNP